MPLSPTEAIIGSGPKNPNGARNTVIDVHVEMLRDANIPARIATLSDVGSEHKARWAEEQGDREPLFIVVPKEYQAQALQVNQSIETGTIRFCLPCDASIKPGATRCPNCGVSDERDPVRLRAEYDAWVQKQGESKYAGMTTNERFFEAGLLSDWDAAARSRHRERMIELLSRVDLGDQAEWIADTVLSNPEKYGF